MMKAERERAIARELTMACAVAGVTQRDLARKLSVSQTSICRLLNGSSTLRMDVADAIARACGHRLVLRVAPGNGLSLRDSGQLGVAQVIEGPAALPRATAVPAPWRLDGQSAQQGVAPVQVFWFAQSQKDGSVSLYQATVLGRPSSPEATKTFFEGLRLP
jgi:transcriptional regulator with XRE-family HTH domain